MTGGRDSESSRPSRLGPQVYRSLTASLLAAGAVTASGLVAGPQFLLGAAPLFVTGGSLFASVAASLAAGTLVRGHERANAGAIAVATSGTVWLLLGKIDAMRAGRSGSADLDAWLIGGTVLAVCLCSYPAAAAGIALRRLIER